MKALPYMGQRRAVQKAGSSRKVIDVYHHLRGKWEIRGKGKFFIWEGTRKAGWVSTIFFCRLPDKGWFGHNYQGSISLGTGLDVRGTIKFSN